MEHANICEVSVPFYYWRFGHQDRITGVDAGLRERVLTSGGRDGTARIWKIVEESQLVFNAPSVLSETPKDSNKKGPGNKNMKKYSLSWKIKCPS